MTRYRRQLTEERDREAQRLQKVLGNANVKLSSVASDVLGVTGRMILDAMCTGERDPDVLADLAQRKLRAKIGDLRQCVPGRFNHHHAVMVGEIVAHVDYLSATIARLDTRVEEMMILSGRQRLDHVHIRVPNRAEAAKWYTEHLGFEPVEAYDFWATAVASPAGVRLRTTPSRVGRRSEEHWRGLRRTSSAVAAGSDGETKAGRL